MSFGESTPVLPHARMPVRGDRLYIDPASDASATADARARCRSVGAGVDAPLQGVAYAVGRADFTKFALSNAWKSGQHRHWRLVEERSTVVVKMVDELKRKRKQASLQAAAPQGANINTYGSAKRRKLLKDMCVRC